MKNRALITVTALASIGFLVGCESADPTNSDIAFEDSEYADAIVQDFAYEVVVPTYELLAARIHALDSAAAVLQQQPNEANLQGAQDAWVAARLPWEQSEGFLFGPVDARGIDPALDSWPVNRTDLDAVLASGDELTAEYLTSLDPTLKGFHTVEYLLFGAEDDQTVADLDSRVLEYLVGVTREMAGLGDELALAWTDGLEGNRPYAELLATAGDPDNTVYPSMTSAAEELVRGSIGILDEVANGKIADPFVQQDPDLVESQFSFNSLEDFADNIRSVQNAYLGGVAEAGTSGSGLTLFVGSIDADLDTRIKAEIQAGIDAIGQIPPPFRDAILDPEAADEILAAQEAIRQAKDTMEQEILPLVTN